MKTRSRILSVILALALCVGMLPTISLTAFAAEATNVKYIDENGVEQICPSATIIEDSDSKVICDGGWYVVNKDVTLSSSYFYGYLTLNFWGNSHLILADGCTLTVHGFMGGADASSLTIYGQSLGTGKLDVTTTVDNSAAAMFFRDSSLTINGGVINANNTLYGYGSGCGINARDLTVNGGTITSKAGSPIEFDNAKYYGGTVTTIDSNNGDATETKTYCSVSFDANGGTDVDKVGVEAGGTLSALPSTTKGGYELKGWYLPDGTTKVTTETTFSADTTVTAKWLETPTAEDFTFTPPANLTYDGVPKTATVTAKDGIAGMGEITVKYEPVSTINAGTYIVKIDVAEGTEYASATNITDATWTFTVLPTIPVDPTTPTASGITYGQTLADSTLTAGWVWADATTVPTVTNNGYTAYYAIADDVNYDWTAIEGYNATEHRLERTVQVTVAKATPAVDPKPTASRVIIGGKLSDSALTGGTASVDGTFAWKDGTEVLDTAQTVTKKVVFTPDDTDNYNTVEIDVDVTVVLCDTTSGEHDHTELKHDDKDHWYECAKCGNVKADSKTAHTFEWKVDKEPTASETGLKHEECSCGAKRNIDTVISKTETDSPPTGDNSNTALWIALLFVSGLGIVATTVYGRKKRQAR